MIIVLCYFNNGEKFLLDMEIIWVQYICDIGNELDFKEWGLGFVLWVEDVDWFIFCCCEFCYLNLKVFCWIFNKFCLGFLSIFIVN